jgi:hypothetical protein
VKPFATLARDAFLVFAVLVAVWLAYVFVTYGFWLHWLWLISAALLLLVALAIRLRCPGSRLGRSAMRPPQTDR